CCWPGYRVSPVGARQAVPSRATGRPGRRRPGHVSPRSER
ncbi:MAG: hypothetical protein AVDCRST_MAG49-2312, partial [uncultured Thermomicrobiales bacterium]